MRKITVAFALSLISMMLILGGANQPATASASLSMGVTDPVGAPWYVIDEGSGEIYTPGSLDIWAQNPTTSIGPSPRLLALDDWTACWILKNDTWKIEQFATSYDGVARNMSIQCGKEDTHGYFHIALGTSNHQQGWRNRISQTDPSANTDSWDDLMWWAAETSWKNPLVAFYQGYGKECRSGKLKMYGPDSNHNIVYQYTFEPTFIWSVTANRLITAIPTTSSYC